MKVAFVSQPWDDVVPPVEAGSIQLITYNLAVQLAAHCEVSVYSRQRAGQPRMERCNGVRFYHMPIRAVDRTMGPLLHVERALGYPFRSRPIFASGLYFPVYFWQVALHLRRERPDIIHIMNFSQAIPLIRMLVPNARIVLHMQCMWLAQLDHDLVARRLRQVDLVLGCSDFITNQVREAFPEFASRCQTLHNGFNPAAVCSTSPTAAATEEPHLLYVGRISPEKGVHVLLSAFERVLQRYPRATLSIVGPTGSAPYDFVVLLDKDATVQGLRRFYSGWLHRDKYLVSLNRQITAQMANRVTFTGPVEHRYLAELYQRCTVFVFPSVCHEAFGIPPLEAMACERPVVATWSGGVPEVVENGETGLLAERGDPEALAGAILELLSDPQRRLAMGEQGRQRAESTFAWEAMGRRLQSYYEQVAHAPVDEMVPNHAVTDSVAAALSLFEHQGR